MKRIQQLTKEINELTEKIEREYPELYRFIDENPITIPNLSHPKMDTGNFADYLDTLKELLRHEMEKKGQ